ncbi:MAG TPA: helix-turn-helix domain-containing protein [Burkholderiaceae bacterium]|nr:helix-turn-helix domain-containing protein [Burkholderiaceae bacterium]
MAPSPTSRQRRSGCPISIALELLGDAWSLLIVRDLMFKERRTFNDFLTGGEGIASNILADRLRKLEDADIIEKRRDPQDARRFIYRLSPKGIDLAPVLVELVIWSARHEQTDAPAAVVRSMRADRDGFVANVRQRWRESS